MKLFVNDTPVEILGKDKPLDEGHYEYTFDARMHNFSSIKLKDDVLVNNASKAYIKDCLDYFNKQKVKKLDSITFVVPDINQAKDFVKSQYLVIEAAGGVVRKDHKVLMIYRLKKWDLPKGKIEKRETPLVGALREVEEECSVKAEPIREVCHTWHTYTRNKKKYLKKTYWYAMDCVDDSQMKAQIEEKIEAVKWMSEAEVKEVLYESYFSIRYVFREYYKQFSI
ncbi:8-oxo-dGTP pyrophosphatase MutT (NUDIX family) [Catalinimonas alkaloidigena]|uniref:NUDIX hydrolase n=1 Tax=Catalinimonas alkaloidigena TaxID=1075417 RepID=UPI002405FE78|nr:NUDIX domain-containing protein [Catalinimonas alkaloidigena]MDF9800436.1 8-oxo-dGTP pyrophosphatase MutT (NUDIX family) [Catalinimonas alkaloidigena]